MSIFGFGKKKQSPENGPAETLGIEEKTLVANEKQLPVKKSFFQIQIFPTFPLIV